MTNGQTYVIIIHVACPIYEILAQLAEHTPFKRRVEGSNPSYLTKSYHVCDTDFCYVGVLERKAALHMESSLRACWNSGQNVL